MKLVSLAVGYFSASYAFLKLKTIWVFQQKKSWQKIFKENKKFRFCHLYNFQKLPVSTKWTYTPKHLLVLITKIQTKIMIENSSQRVSTQLEAMEMKVSFVKRIFGQKTETNNNFKFANISKLLLPNDTYYVSLRVLVHW